MIKKFQSIFILSLLTYASIAFLHEPTSQRLSNEAKNKVVSLVLEDRAVRVEAGQWLIKCNCPLADKYFIQHKSECYKNNRGNLDCGGLAHFMCTGRNGNIKNIADGHKDKVVIIIDGISEIAPKHHKPYTIYELLSWGIGGWAGIHYFSHLNEGHYISNTGGKSSRIFSSFADEVKGDGFPSTCGFPKKPEPQRRWEEFTDNPLEAYIADRIACGWEDMEFTHDEFERLKNILTQEEQDYFLSKIPLYTGFQK